MKNSKIRYILDTTLNDRRPYFPVTNELYEWLTIKGSPKLSTDKTYKTKTFHGKLGKNDKADALRKELKGIEQFYLVDKKELIVFVKITKNSYTVIESTPTN